MNVINMETLKANDKSGLVSGYFQERTNVGTLLFYDYERDKVVQTHCTMNVEIKTRDYILQVSYENELAEYVVICIVDEQRRKWSNELSVALAPKAGVPFKTANEYVASLTTKYHAWVHLDIVNELKRILYSQHHGNPPVSTVEFLRNEQWESLVYDSQPFYVRPDVLAEWIPDDSELIDEARIWNGVVEATKRYRAVWLGDNHLRQVKRLAKWEETIERMIQKKRLKRSASGKLALSWAADLDARFIPCAEATFTDAPWGFAHEMSAVWTCEKGKVRSWSKRKDFVGNRSAPVDWFVDRRIVVVTMCNERNWVKEKDQGILKVIPSGSVEGQLLSKPRVRIGFALRPEEKAREVLKFLQQRGMQRVLFVFTYPDLFLRRDCERGFHGSKVFQTQNPLTSDHMGFVRQNNVFFVAADGTFAWNAKTNDRSPNFQKTQNICLFQTCVAYEMFNLNPELFQAIVLFVRKETDYGWLIEADRVAGTRLLVVVDDQPVADPNTRVRSTALDWPTIYDAMVDVHKAFFRVKVEQQEQQERKIKKRRIGSRPYETIESRGNLPSNRDLASLQSYFETKVSPNQWSKTPVYGMSKSQTCLEAFCGARCGSKKMHQPVYSLCLSDGSIIRYTDMHKKTLHGPDCLK
jgi:hypothetical protein